MCDPHSRYSFGKRHSPQCARIDFRSRSNFDIVRIGGRRSLPRLACVGRRRGTTLNAQCSNYGLVDVNHSQGTRTLRRPGIQLVARSRSHRNAMTSRVHGIDQQRFACLAAGRRLACSAVCTLVIVCVTFAARTWYSRGRGPAHRSNATNTGDEFGELKRQITAVPSGTTPQFCSRRRYARRR